MALQDMVDIQLVIMIIICCSKSTFSAAQSSAQSCNHRSKQSEVSRLFVRHKGTMFSRKHSAAMPLSAAKALQVV